MNKFLMSSGLAFGLGLGAVAAPAMADSVTLYCAADEAWCQQIMARDFEAETGITRRHDPQELRRDLCPGPRRGRQPQGRRLVGRHRRPAPPGRARKSLTEAYESPMMRRAPRLGDQAGRGRRQPHRRRLLRRARLRLQQGPARQERPARAEVLGRPDQARVQGPDPDGQPQLLGHRLHHARDPRAADGRGQRPSTTSRRSTATSTSTPSPAPPRSRPPASARPRSASSSCTTPSPRPPPASRS